MREPLSNSRLGQQEEFFWYSRAPFPLYPFHFDICFTPSTLLSCSRCFSRFHSVPFSFPQSRFFDYYFFSGPLFPPVAARVFFRAVTGDGHYSMSRGVSYPPKPCYPHIFARPYFRRTHLSSFPRSSARPQLPRYSRTIPRSTRNPNLALSQENQ